MCGNRTDRNRTRQPYQTVDRRSWHHPTLGHPSNPSSASSACLLRKAVRIRQLMLNLARKFRLPYLAARIWLWRIRFDAGMRRRRRLVNLLYPTGTLYQLTVSTLSIHPCNNNNLQLDKPYKPTTPNRYSCTVPSSNRYRHQTSNSSESDPPCAQSRQTRAIARIPSADESDAYPTQTASTVRTNAYASGTLHAHTNHAYQPDAPTAHRIPTGTNRRLTSLYRTGVVLIHRRTDHVVKQPGFDLLIYLLIRLVCIDAEIAISRTEFEFDETNLILAD